MVDTEQTDNPTSDWYVVHTYSGQEERVRRNLENRIESLDAPRVSVGYSTGESVKITDGPFLDFMGSVEEVNEDRGKVIVMVSFFGRETPVELDFLQVEKI